MSLLTFALCLVLTPTLIALGGMLAVAIVLIGLALIKRWGGR